MLQDGSEIMAVFRSRSLTEHDGTASVQRTHTVLGVPDLLSGSIRQGDTLTAALDAGDGWEV